MQVCLGMKQILDSNPQVTVAFEYSPESMRVLGFDPEALLKFFWDRKFNLYRLERKAQLIAFDHPTTAQRLSERGYLDIVAAPTALK